MLKFKHICSLTLLLLPFCLFANNPSHPYASPNTQPQFFGSQTNQQLDFSSQTLGLTGPLAIDAQYSSALGAVFGANYTQLLGDKNAIALKFEGGTQSLRGNLTYGLALTPKDRLKVSGEYLAQQLFFNFTTGSTHQWLGQGAAGIQYEHQLPYKWLSSFNLGGYASKAQNKNLSTVNYSEDGILYQDQRAIIGGRSMAGNLGISLLPTPTARISTDFTYDGVHYKNNYEDHGTDNNSQPGAKIKWEQLLGTKFKTVISASDQAIGNEVSAAINWLQNEKLEWSLGGGYYHGKTTGFNNTTVGMKMLYRIESLSHQEPTYGNFTPETDLDLARFVSNPAVYMPEVLAISDEKITRLTPTGSPIDLTFSSGELIDQDITSYFSSPDGSPLIYTGSGLPPGIFINPIGKVVGQVFSASTFTTIGQVTATTLQGHPVTVPITIKINGTTDVLPTLNPISDQTVVLGNSIAIQPTTSAGTHLIFAATNLPEGITIDSTTGLISGTPTTPGSYVIEVMASNAAGFATTSFTLGVLQSASWTPIPDQTVTINNHFQLDFSQYGLGTPVLNYAVSSSLPPGISFSGTLIAGTPTTLGDYLVTATIVNPYTASPVATDFTIHVVNSLPTITTPPTQTGVLTQNFNLDLSAFSTGTHLTYSVSGLPSWATLNPSTGLISGIPSNPGTSSLIATVSNTAGQASTQAFNLIISLAPPVFNPIGGQNVAINNPYSLDLSNYIQGTGPFTYTESGLPAGLSLNTTTGLISGSSTLSNTFPITVTGTNAGGTAQQTFILNVGPSIGTPPAQITSVGQMFNLLMANYASTTGSSPTYSATGLPLDLSINPNTGLIFGTPAAPSVSDVTVSVNNPGGSATTGTFSITINALAPNLPTINNPGNQTILANTPFNLNMGGYANGLGPLSFTSTGLPPGLSMDINGLITGTPTTTGSYPVKVTVNNNAGSASTNFNIIVNANPAIATPANQTGLIGTFFHLDMATYASGAGPLTFAVNNLPPGLTMPTNGFISGTPTTAGTVSVTVTVTNAFGMASTNPFSITITAPTPPNINNPGDQNTLRNTIFSPITLTATGTAPLTFSAIGLPTGLSLNTNTGVISGSVTSVSGTYPVTITVTDGNNLTASTTFNVRVRVPPPTLNNPGNRTTNVGSPFDLSLTATGLELLFTANGLPAGLSINPATGFISGLPNTAGNFPVTATVTNSGGSASVGFNINVIPPFIFSALPTVNAKMYLSITTINIPSYITGTYTSITASPNCSSAGNCFPIGITFTGTQVMGTPSRTLPGVYTPVIRVSNGTYTITQTLRIRLNA